MNEGGQLDVATGAPAPAATCAADAERPWLIKDTATTAITAGIAMAMKFCSSGSAMPTRVPIAIGTLVGMALPLEQNFMAIAIPAVIAVVAVSLISHGRSASAAQVAAGAGAPVATSS